MHYQYLWQTWDFSGFIIAAVFVAFISVWLLMIWFYPVPAAVGYYLVLAPKTYQYAAVELKFILISDVLFLIIVPQHCLYFNA